LGDELVLKLSRFGARRNRHTPWTAAAHKKPRTLPGPWNHFHPGGRRLAQVWLGDFEATTRVAKVSLLAELTLSRPEVSNFRLIRKRPSNRGFAIIAFCASRSAAARPSPLSRR